MINLPEVAIAGLGKARPSPRYDEAGNLVKTTVMQVGDMRASVPHNWLARWGWGGGWCAQSLQPRTRERELERTRGSAHERTCDAHERNRRALAAPGPAQARWPARAVSTSVTRARPLLRR